MEIEIAFIKKHVKERFICQTVDYRLNLFLL